MPFREKGVPSVQQIEDKTSDFNRYYHQAGDTVEHMDSEYWQAMMRGLVATIATWAEVQLAAAPTQSVTPALTAAPEPSATPAPTETPTTLATVPPSPTPSPEALATPLPLLPPVLLPVVSGGRR